MDDLYSDEEINNNLAAKATAFEDLLAGRSLSDDTKGPSTTSTEGTDPTDKTGATKDEAKTMEEKLGSNLQVKPPQHDRISPASQIYQTVRSAVDAAFFWLGKIKDQLKSFVEEAKKSPEHPLSQMCKNLQSIVILLEAKGNEVLDPSSTTFGFVETSLSRLLEYLAELEEMDESGWVGENAVKPAKRIEENLAKLKDEHMMVDGRRKAETVDEEDRVVIESSSSEDVSDEDEIERKPRVILKPKSRRSKLKTAHNV